MATRVFLDTFNNQSAIDTSKWYVVTNHTMTGMWATTDFLASMVTVSSDRLHLRVEEGAPTSGKLYSAGFVGTNTTYTGGYFSARIWLPVNAKGSCMAFWMNTPPGVKPEIDILETQGNASNHFTLHEASGESFGVQTTPKSQSPTNNFHDYDCEWVPGDRLVYYVDGVETARLTHGQVMDGKTIQIPTTAQDVKLNSSIGNFGYTNNTVDGTTVFPMEMLVEHVEVWDAKP